MFIVLSNPILACCGDSHNLCFDSNNKLWGFGCNTEGQLGIKNNYPNLIKTPTMNEYFKNTMIEQIQCGWSHSLVIDNAQNCYLFGFNLYGQIGIGQNNVKRVFMPHLIQSIDSMKGISIRYGSLGFNHTLLITESNQIFSFGSNAHNQCSSILRKLNWIVSPYLLSSEINNNSNLLINKVIGGHSCSIIIMNAHSFYSNKNDSQQIIN